MRDTETIGPADGPRLVLHDITHGVFMYFKHVFMFFMHYTVCYHDIVLCIMCYMYMYSMI